MRRRQGRARVVGLSVPRQKVQVLRLEDLRREFRPHRLPPCHGEKGWAGARGRRRGPRRRRGWRGGGVGGRGGRRGSGGRSGTGAFGDGTGGASQPQARSGLAERGTNVQLIRPPQLP
ncbi:hypothetical protein I4F81_010715 [Pyropia yezoensis]|uniref:Uncharacterized protein n=1 Tax=Pyropia yezoensis TaxID=2788 RepID=A0ACC3CDF8_PYRYE|nr:hypothetical protein I4F81_010715 [Neopyropia yezoensis]